MKICQKCGTENQDHEYYCSVCRVKLGPSLEEQEKKLAKQKEVFEVFKSVGSSKIVLAIILLFIVSIAFSVYGLLNLDETILNVYPNLPLETFSQTMILTCILAIVFSIPSIMLFIGLIKLYSSSKKATESINTSGLSLIRASSMYNLVLFCILAAFSLTTLPVFIVFLLIEGMCVLGIVYYAKLNKTIDSIIFAVNTKTTAIEISTYVIVMNYIFVVFALIGFIYAFSIQSLLGAVLTLLCAVLLTYLDSKIKKVRARKAVSAFYNRDSSFYIPTDAPSVCGNEPPLYRMALPKLEKRNDTSENKE
ncbi:MAG: hypothetical protein GX802_06385 [Clostridiales bacterium]|nr:hypothetical protein [Clostridiales bacterium]